MSSAAQPVTGRPGDSRSHSTAATAPSGIDPSLLVTDILASLAEGVVVVDTNDHIIHYNPAAERILGRDLLENPPASWNETCGLFCDDGRSPVPRDQLPLARAIRGELVQEAQLVVRNTSNPDGLWVSVNASPIRDAAGAICGGIAVVRDVSAAKRELARIRLLSAAVEQTADIVIVTRPDGVIEYVNPATERITGYSERELVGQTPRIFKSGSHDRVFYEQMWKTIHDGQVFRGTLINRKKDGDVFYAEQTIAPIRDSSGAITHYVSVGKDITELRRAAALESKLQLARLVQQRLYPKAPPRACGLEVAGAAVTADQTGGDYYDYLSLPDGRIAIVIGDVSGHGFDAALLMATTRSYLRSILQAPAEPGDALSLLNGLLHADTAENQFVTLLLAFVDPVARTLRYASAGHPTGYLLGCHGEIRQELTSSGPPLGLFGRATIESMSADNLRDGDLVALFTDGVLDAEDSSGTPFGADRALAVVRQRQSEPPGAIVECLQNAVTTYAGRGSRADDITAVICKFAACDPVPAPPDGSPAARRAG